MAKQWLWMAVISVWAIPALADTHWTALQGSKLRDALVSRTLGFETGRSVGFFSDGKALRGMEWGRWWPERDQLCMDWPDHPLRCYTVSQRGIDLKFEHNGRVISARYIDLN